MRPRVFPAEDSRDAGTRLAASHASMRPRVFPAEDSRHAVTHRSRCRFNEAAGIPRGRLGSLPRSAPDRVVASMRPRVFPAEDEGRPRRPTPSAPSFNEAAGIPRGRLETVLKVVAPLMSLQ